VPAWEVEPVGEVGPAPRLGQAGLRRFRVLCRRKAGEGLWGPSAIASSGPIRVEASGAGSEVEGSDGLIEESREVAVTLAAQAGVGAYHGALLLRWPDGSAFWLPVRSVRRSFDDEDRIFGEPLYERSMAIVEGSLQLNPDLPNALFSVARASALPLPGELERIEKGAKSGKLRLQFESQPTPKPEPLKTDPVSVRGRIDKHLAEANRQSKELEASSPARRSWDGAMALQLGFAAAGVALLGGVAARKWRNR